MPEIDRILYRVAEAGQAIGVSRSRMYELIASGEIPSVRVGNVLRVPVDGLREWAKRKATQSTKDAA